MQTRRAVLSGVAAAVAGCAGVPGNERPVTILAAGSLTTALERGLRPAVDVPLRTSTRGSAALARLVATDTRHPNIVSVADPALFDGPLHPSWYATYATNAIVLAYNPRTQGGRAVASAGPTDWWRPILTDTTRIGRTDPDLDPLGYRTLFTLELAADHYDRAPPLRDRIPTRRQLYPETQLLAQFETGGIDAAFTYRSMAIERDYPYLELPGAIDLSDPAFAETYREATYTLPGGTTVHGDVIRYAATIHEGMDRASVRTVFDTHVEGAYLDRFGFTAPIEYPVFRGDVPQALRR